MVLTPIVYWLASPLFINVKVNERLEGIVGQQFVIVATGTFVNGDDFHKTSGVATILRSSNGTRIASFTDFKTINGPDLFVYLTTDASAKDVVDLGRLKGNVGDQHYQLPSDVDLTHYKYVLIWCRSFSVLFGSAQLS